MSTPRLSRTQQRHILGEMLAMARRLGANGVPTREITAHVALLRDDLVDAARHGREIKAVALISEQEDRHRELGTEREHPHV
jgi:hypothetical protein